MASQQNKTLRRVNPVQLKEIGLFLDFESKNRQRQLWQVRLQREQNFRKRAEIMRLNKIKRIEFALKRSERIRASLKAKLDAQTSAQILETYHTNDFNDMFEEDIKRYWIAVRRERATDLKRVWKQTKKENIFINFSAHSNLCDPDIIVDDIDSEVEEDDVTTHHFNYNKYYNTYHSDKCQQGTYVPKIKIVRNSYLLGILRNVIKKFVNIRLGRIQKCNPFDYFKNIHSKIDESCQDIELVDIPTHSMSTCNIKYGKFEMDSAQGNNVPGIELKANNVVITDEVVPEKATPMGDLQLSWRQKCTTEAPQSYDYMVDRWFNVETFEWSSIGDGKEIVLPRDIISSLGADACSYPNVIPFLVHRYSRYHMTVMLRVSSQKFQYGALQVSWLYLPHLDKNIAHRKNIYSLSQTNHVVIQAGASNSGILEIPHLYHKQYTLNKPMNQHSPPLMLGTLYIQQLASLKGLSTIAKASGLDTASITVSVKFSNCEFVGLMPGNIHPFVSEESEYTMVDKQMMPALGVGMAMSLLNQMSPDKNRDNPPVTRPPSLIVPTGSHSWCVGTGISEPVHTLRLDGKGQTPHPGLINDITTFTQLAQVPALVTQFSWSTASAANSRLTQFAASPIWEFRYYSKVASFGEGHLPSYRLPPLAVVSACHTYWRGTLHFDFEFVANQFFTGKLMVGYVPGANKNTTVYYSMIRSSPNVEFTVQDQLKWRFTVPFVSDTPWWGRQHDQVNVEKLLDPPGYVYIYIINKLKCTSDENNNTNIKVNMYVSAGEDFEVSVPCQPSVGLCWNDVYVPPSGSVVYVIKGYYPIYAGIWRYLVNSNFCIYRYGPVSDHIAQLDASKFSKPYYLVNVKNKDKVWEVPKFKFSYSKIENGRVVSTEIEASPRYAVPWFTGGYCYIIPCYVEADASALSAGIFRNGDKFITYQSLKLYGLTFINASEYSTVDVQPAFSMHFVDTAYGDSQMNELNPQTQNLVSASTSTMGENFNDIKNLTRRYQLYGAIPISAASIEEDGKCIGIAPVLPQGLINPIYASTKSINLSNFCREGHIPILASAFRYGRGGVRLRIVGPSGNFNVWVQHRPDMRWNNSTFRPCNRVTSASGIMNHTYATYIQSAQVNSISEIEIPYYKSSPFILLQQPIDSITADDAQYIGLGEVFMGIQANKKSLNITSDFDLVLFYSLADDFSFYGFQGFPPMINIRDIGDNPKLGSPQMFGLGALFPTLNVTDAIKTEIGNAANDLRQSIDSGAATVGENVRNHGLQFANLVFSNLAHTAADPSATHIAITLASTLSGAGILSMDTIQNFIQFVQPVVNKICSWGSGNQRPETDVPREGMPQSDTIEWNDADITTGLAIFMSSICALAGTVVEPPKDKASFVNLLTKGLDKHSRLSFNLIRLFNNCVETIKKLWKYVFGVKNPLLAQIEMLDNNKEFIKSWCYEVLYLTSPDTLQKLESASYADKIGGQASLIDRVNDCYSFGSVLLCESLNVASEIKSFNLIRDCYKRITDIKERLVCLGKYPLLRQEPVLIWSYGKSGVMKTTVMKTIMPKLLKDCGIDYGGESPYYPWNPASKHQSGCCNQPAAFFNDFWTLVTEQAINSSIEFVMTGKDSAPWSPEMAEIEAKYIRYAPSFLFITSNHKYIASDYIGSKEAFHRRIDVLYRQSFPKKYSEYEGLGVDKLLQDHPSLQESISDYSFFVFNILKDPTNANSPWGPNLTYDEFYKSILQTSKELRLKRYTIFKKTIDETYSDINVMDPKDPHEGVSLIKKLELIRFKNIQESMKRSTLAHSGIVGVVKEYLNEKFEILYSHISNSHLLNTGNRILQEVEAESASTPMPNTPDVGSAQILHYPSGSRRIGRYENFLGYDKVYDNLCFVESGIVEIKAICHTLGILDFEVVYKLLSSIILTSPLRNEKVRNLEEFIEILKILNFTEYYKECEHANVFSMDVECAYDEDKIQCGFKECNIKSFCKERCVFKDTFIQFLFWNATLNPTCKIAIRAEPSSTLLPLYFRQVAAVSRNNTLFEDGWAKLKTWGHWFKEQASSLCKTIWWGITEMWHYIKPILAIVLSMIVITGAVVGVEKMMGIKSREDKFIEDLSKTLRPLAPQGLCSGMQTAVHRVGTRVDPKLVKPQNLNAKGDNVVRIVQANYCHLVKYGALRESVGRCLMLANRKCLVIRHYIEIFKSMPGEDVYFETHDRKQRFVFNLSECDIQWFGSSDSVSLSNFGILHLPIHIREYRNIIKHIAPLKAHKKVSRENSLIVDNNIHFAQTTFTQSPYWVKEDYPTTEVRMRCCYEYMNLSKPGHCGSVLISNSMNEPIIGMHVAGSSDGMGCAEPLYQEMFDEVVNLDPDVYIPEFAPVDLNECNWEATVFPLGRVPKEYCQKQSGKTRIIPSGIHGTYVPTKEPAPLAPNDARLPKGCDPLKDGCYKHGLYPRSFPLDIVERAQNDLESKILANVSSVRLQPEILSDEQAVCGIPDVVGFDAINWTTSEGFPLSSSRPKRAMDKKWLFDLTESGEGYKLHKIREPLASQLQLQRMQREQGIKPFTVFADCLKDSCIDIEKCKIPGKTRIFSISPLAYTIEFRKYFSDFMASYTKAGVKAEHGVGTSADGGDWGALARYLSYKGNKIIAADYSNFGPGLHTQLAGAACNIILAWISKYQKYSDLNMSVCRILLSELIGSIHLMNDVLYIVPCGIPSGSPVTAILNSLVNSLYIRVCWQLVFINNPYYRSLSCMHEHLNILVYGDDLCINVTDECCQYFNTVTMSRALHLYDIKLTDIDKSGTILPFRTLENVTFLKRGFVPHPHRPMEFLAPLDIASVTDCSNWIHNTNSDRFLATKVNCVQACDLAYGHGPIKHKQICANIKNAFEERYGEYLPVRTWEDLDYIYFS